MSAALSCGLEVIVMTTMTDEPGLLEPDDRAPVPDEPVNDDER